MALNSNTYYRNQGNRNIAQFLSDSDRRFLDIGCGAGNNAATIRTVSQSANITGLTCSLVEYNQAMQNLDSCFLIDVEKDEVTFLEKNIFDVLLFCHVLEHLVNPVAVIQKLLPYLKVGGKVVIALPNIANWRSRSKLVLGNFEYTDGGIMDKTHLRFYTFYSAPHYLIEPIPELKLIQHLVSGNLPLAVFRHHLLSFKLKNRIDNIGCRLMPNLFGHEILMMALRIF